MNISEQQFQQKLDEIGKAYEDGKDAVYAMMLLVPMDDITKALGSLHTLRNLAATALQAQFMIKEN